MSDVFNKQYNEYLTAVENYLEHQCFNNTNLPQKNLFEAMRYSLLAGGKRLRPIFVLDFCKMCGGNVEQAIPVAAAVEMIHTYSLIHDDLPCMDNDDYRRGKLTNHKVYGEAMAVLAGDALLTSAFSQLAAAEFPAEVRIEAVKVLSECAGELGMVGGQVLDIEGEKHACNAEEILAIHTGKTVALIRAACVMGVLCGNGSIKQLNAANDFAYHLGLSFQIRDDMLDVIGAQEQLGKAVGTDINKNTFVRLYGIEHCDQLVKEHTNMALLALKEFEDHQFMLELSNILISRNH